VVSLETDSPLIVLLGNNIALTRIKSWSIESDYLQSVDGFEFVVVADSPEHLRGLEAQPVTLMVAGVPQLVGRIDQTQRGDDGYAVTCTGRDYIADLVECNIDPTITAAEGETLGGLILKAVAPVGITKLSPDSDSHVVIDVRLGIQGKTKRKKGKKQPHTATLQNLKPNLGQGIYEFLKPLCDHHNCTLQPTMHRDTILVGTPHYDQDPAYAIVRNIDRAASNNVLSASVTRDYSSFPTITIVQGQGAARTGEPVGPSTATIDTVAQTAAYGGELGRTLSAITWSGRRDPKVSGAMPVDKIYRLNIFRDDKAKSADEINAIAKKLFFEHLRKTLVYRVKLRGHLDPVTGAVWSVNTIVRVSDAVCDINEDLWIQSRKLSFNEGSGPVTDLVCIRRESFDFEVDVKPAATGKLADDSRKQAPDRFYEPQNYNNPFSLNEPTPRTPEQQLASPNYDPPEPSGRRTSE
jgi:prophage tail gpP-like protein